MRFYTNENFPLPVVFVLRDLGHDVLTSVEAGNANREVPDAEVLRFATAADRVVLTLNRRDFIALHSFLPIHAGIVVCTLDTDFARQARKIHDLAMKHSVLHGPLVRINRGE